MATIAPPNAALFDADPLEQIYAKGTLDRNMAGLSALMMAGAGMKADARRQDYMGSLDAQNVRAGAMEQLAQQTKLREARMKETSPLIKDGFDWHNLPGGADLQSADDPMTALIRTVQQSIANKNNAEAAHAGDKGGESTTVQTQQAPFGPGMTTVTTKGKDAAGVAKSNADRMSVIRADMMSSPQKYTAQQQQYIMQQAPKQYGVE